MENSKLVLEFIDQIWNKRNFEKLNDFLHTDFQDHSLPSTITADKDGLKKWILGTGTSFEHNTKIEEQVTEGNNSMLKIRMDLKHIGIWRDIEPTNIDLKIIGYRYFKLQDGKIIEHWGLIDGQSIENQLKNIQHRCKIAE